VIQRNRALVIDNRAYDQQYTSCYAIELRDVLLIIELRISNTLVLVQFRALLVEC